MVKQLWINLPVKDLGRAKHFFTGIGFRINPAVDNEQMVCILVGEMNTAVMLFDEKVFPGVSQNPVSNTQQGSEVLFSFDVDSIGAIDELAEKVTAMGGILFSKPAWNQGWMYGCAFTDPDGHRWNALYMDMSKMPGAN
jgi:predicted lactoylglutathione lyase